MIKMQAISKIRKVAILLTICLSSALVGCGTIAPKPVVDGHGSFDETTPEQYNQYQSGFLGWIVDKDDTTIGVMVTPHFVERYNILLSNYKRQLEKEQGVKVSTGTKKGGKWTRYPDGVAPIDDKYGNHVYKIGARHHSYFLKMNRWRKENKPVDSIWMKLSPS
jgi:hypothetical protein